MNRLVVKGGRVVDPASGIDGIYNVYVMGGRIASVKEAARDSTVITEGAEGLDVIDATGLLVTPGLIDMHTHLRDPGYEYKETVETGAKAAAAGGFTSIACMANTKPVNDCESVTRYILTKAEATGVNVMPVGALSAGLKGERLSEMAELKAAGCVAVSDDGVPVTNGALMRRALEYSRIFGMPVISHSEDPTLAGAGVMNEGAASTRFGLKGIPNAAEAGMVARDILLAGLTGGRLHIAHVSARESVELIRLAKEKGLNVTAEVTPHHLTLTEEAVEGYNTNARMSPPLRTAADVEALRKALKDGVIGCVASDHAPHSLIEKDVEFDRASNGIIGLETSFSLMYGLVADGVIPLSVAVRAMTINPAKALGMDRGSLRVGSIADMTLIDLDAVWRVEPQNIRSRSKNTPYTGMEMRGRVVRTIAGGRTIYNG